MNAYFPKCFSRPEPEPVVEKPIQSSPPDEVVTDEAQALVNGDKESEGEPGMVCPLFPLLYFSTTLGTLIHISIPLWLHYMITIYELS